MIALVEWGKKPLPKKNPATALTIEDDGVLSEDERFVNQYRQIVEDLQRIFLNKVKTSKPGDDILMSASAVDNDREETLFRNLEDLYVKKIQDRARAQVLTTEMEAKLFDAAKALKPEYDAWVRTNKGKGGAGPTP